MHTVTIDAGKTVGKIKPLHGVNNGPKTQIFNYDTSKYFTEAGIPFARLHDTEYPYGSGHFVDIHCIFPDFNADPDLPASYDFTLTDIYIKAIYDAGTEVFYRLGESIEHAPKKYYIYPPKDNLKWAKICAGVIRHYNEGWAEGFHYNIQYWEIWNEPDNERSAASPMWQGTEDEFFRLYVTAANYLKKQFSTIKIGGYASCGFYAVTREKLDESCTFVQSPSRIAGFVAFFHDFLKYISSPEHAAPLDFFSWHLYSSSVAEMATHARYAADTLIKYGFTKTETILNEWNYAGEDMFNQMRKEVGACYVAASFCALQKSPVAAAMYYDAQPALSYGGLFEKLSTIPSKAYYAFKAFNALYRHKHEVYSCSDAENIYVCAAASESGASILICNYLGTDGEVAVHVKNLPAAAGSCRIECYTLDAANNLDLTQTISITDRQANVTISLKTNSFVLLKMEQS
jgi:hypothetical protein